MEECDSLKLERIIKEMKLKRCEGEKTIVVTVGSLSNGSCVFH